LIDSAVWVPTLALIHADISECLSEEFLNHMNHM
jgi:hypothetical protein